MSARDMLLEARYCIGMAYKTRKLKWLRAARYWIQAAHFARVGVPS